MDEETSALLGENSTDNRSSIKKTIISATCAFLASIIFSANNLLIQEKNLRCSDLLFFRSILQSLTFSILIKLSDKQLFPGSETQSRREFIIETIYLISQVIFI